MRPRFARRRRARAASPRNGRPRGPQQRGQVGRGRAVRKHHRAGLHAIQPFEQHVAVPFKAMRRFALGLVALAETDQVGHERAQPGQAHELPEEVAPFARAVQAQAAGCFAFTAFTAFIDVVHAPAPLARQVLHVVRREGVAGQRVEAFLRRAQRVVAQGFGLRARGAPALLEEGLQHRGALLRQHPALHQRAMVQPRFGEEIEHRTGCTGLGIGRAVHDARQPRMQHCPRAHRARFQRDEQLAAIEPVVAERCGTGAQRVDLGMRARIVLCDRRVAACRDQLAVLDQHSADGHFACLGGKLRLGERERHPVRVARHRRGNGLSCHPASGAPWSPRRALP